MDFRVKGKVKSSGETFEIWAKDAPCFGRFTNPLHVHKSAFTSSDFNLGHSDWDDYGDEDLGGGTIPDFNGPNDLEIDYVEATYEDVCPESNMMPMLDEICTFWPGVDCDFSRGSGATFISRRNANDGDWAPFLKLWCARDVLFASEMRVEPYLMQHLKEAERPLFDLLYALSVRVERDWYTTDRYIIVPQGSSGDSSFLGMIPLETAIEYGNKAHDLLDLRENDSVDLRRHFIVASILSEDGVKVPSIKLPHFIMKSGSINTMADDLGYPKNLRCSTYASLVRLDYTFEDFLNILEEYSDDKQESTTL